MKLLNFFLINILNNVIMSDGPKGTDGHYTDNDGLIPIIGPIILLSLCVIIVFFFYHKIYKNNPND